MTVEGDHRHGSTLHDHLNVLRRRKWIILQAVIIVPALAVFLAMRHQKLYSAESQVLVNYEDVAAQVTGTGGGGSTVYQTVERIASTLAIVAHTLPVAKNTVHALQLRERTPGSVLGETSVSADPLSNLLYVTATDTDPVLARRIANEYAKQFTLYLGKLDTAQLHNAIVSAQKSLHRLEARGQADSPLHSNLAQRLELLRELETLQTARASVAQEADYAYQIAPRPFRNGILGLLLGAVLGIGLAFLREALDTRVRSADEIGEKLGLPLLARLPEPPRRLRRENRLVMTADPTGPQAEAFRMLRTNLDFVRVDRDARTIMVTSAVESEGKSTTSANLAAALARVGPRVVLVDLDLRRPFLHKFFDLEGRPGLTQVAVGHADLEAALTQVPLMPPRRLSDPLSEPVNSNGGNGRVEGLLEVLGSGPIPPNVDEFVGTSAVADILARLRKRADVVIVDSTPLLVVGDAMALTRAVDALVVVTRMNTVRRPMLRELRRVLDATPTEKLGFIVTGADSGEGYGGYAYRYRAYTGPRSRKEVAR
jgi:polysaccharide biosynthesis transport protein